MFVRSVDGPVLRPCDGFDEKIKGSIEAGKLADMVIITKDYLTCPVDEIRNIEPLRTTVDGRVVWNDPSSPIQ